VFDFAQIEARVLAWLTGQTDVLEVFRRGEDVYEFTARKAGLNSRLGGKVMVLGLGYGAGWKRFIEIAAAYGLILDDETSQKMVSDWRASNAETVSFWYDLDTLVKQALATGATRRLRTVGIAVRQSVTGNRTLVLTLPSGRNLYYQNVRLRDDPDHPGREMILFDGMETGRWTTVKTYGAKLTENIVQALARDIMAEAMLRMDRILPGVGLVLTVHDELVYEISHALEVTPTLAKTILETVPDWARGLPVSASGSVMDRYGKN
jgi:DNA polymerase